MFPKPVLVKGIRTAVIVGTLLTIINQWQGIFTDAPFKWLPFVLTYLVPFCVYLYSFHANQIKHPLTQDKE